MWKPPLGCALQALPSGRARVPPHRTCPAGHRALRDDGVQGNSGKQPEAAPTFHIERSPAQVRMGQLMPEITGFVNIKQSCSALTVYLANLDQETDL